MGAVAFAPARTATFAELAARGAVIRIVVEGLAAERVELTAPRDVAQDLRAAIAWRVSAMRAQLAAEGRTGLRATPVAVPGLVLPLAPRCAWKGWREQYGRKVFVTLEAQRPAPGLCASCGEDTPGETGDCMLCCAARVAALRAEGRIGAPTPMPARAYPTEAAWRAELVAAAGARLDPLPPPRAPAPWTCRVCQHVVEGLWPDPDMECGPCEMRRASVLSTARLGGATP